MQDRPFPITRRQFVRVVTGAAAAVGAGGALLAPRRGSAAPPVWTTIPNQTWVVGVPVHLDLADYSSDPDGDPLGFDLDEALPAGVTLTDGVISGTPTAVFRSRSYIASADDGEPPAPPTGLRVL